MQQEKQQKLHKYAKERRDQFYKQAKLDGYRARSAYKLEEINNYFHILDNQKYIVDLCCAPGSWSQYLAKTCGKGSKIVSIDLAPIAPIEGVIFIQGDITSEETANKCISYFVSDDKPNENHLADVIVCDGAPDVTGLNIDEFIQSQLIQSAMKIVRRILKQDGVFVSKIFRGQLTEVLLEQMAKEFSKVQIVKPLASRQSSMESFLVCQGFQRCEQISKDFKGQIIPGVQQIGDGKDPDMTYEN